MDVDFELVQKAQRGNAQAANELMSKYTKIARHIAARKRVNESDIDDVAQDIMMHVNKALGSFHFQSSFRTWVYSIANHRVADYYRHIAREAKILESGAAKTARLKRFAAQYMPSGLYGGIPYSYINAQEFAFITDQGQAQDHAGLEFDDMIGQLSAKHREVLKLHLYWGLDYNEMSRVLGGTYESNRSLYRRGIAELKQRMEY